MGARWAAQNILKRYRDARLRVYVVWVKRWALDTRAEIDGAGMIDPRVTHLWDAGNVIGQGFLEGAVALPRSGQAEGVAFSGD